MKASSRLFDVYLRAISLNLKRDNIATHRITVSKKVSPKATERNYIKRQIKEILRFFLHTAKNAENVLNISVIVKKEAMAQKFSTLNADLTNLLKNLSDSLK